MAMLPQPTPPYFINNKEPVGAKLDQPSWSKQQREGKDMAFLEAAG